MRPLKKERQVSTRGLMRMAGNLAVPILIVDASYETLWSNKAFEQWIGEAEPTLLDLVHGDDFGQVMAQMEDAQGEVLIRSRLWIDGEIVPVELSVVVDDDLFYITVSDTSERVDRQVRLERQVRLIALAERYAALGYWHVDLSDNTVFWSPVIYEIHGVDPETYTPKFETAVGFFAAEDRVRLEEKWKIAVANKTGYDMDASLIRPDGTIVRVHTSAQIELDASGEPIGVVGIFQDITERERQERRRAHSDRLTSLGTLAAGLAHEVNNPLAITLANIDFVGSVLGRVEVGEASPDEVVEAIEAVSEAVAGAHRVSSIVASLRTFGPWNGAAPRIFDLRVLLSDVLAAHARVEGLSYGIGLIDESADVFGEGAIFGEVVEQLVDNAERAVVESGRDDGHIGIYLSRAADHFVIEVIDNGVGMTPAVLQKVFEPFFTTRDVDQGKGLGLSSCLGVVTSLGGTIDISSEPGQGTSVTMKFPTADVDPDDSGEDQTEASEVKDVVFLVDDEPLVGRAIRRTFGGQFDLRVFESVDEAQAQIEAGERPSAIICDIMMPGRTGLDLFHFVEGYAQELSSRFIFLTGGVFSVAVEELIQKVDAPRIAKPFSSAHLKQVVGDVVASN